MCRPFYSLPMKFLSPPIRTPPLSRVLPVPAKAVPRFLSPPGLCLVDFFYAGSWSLPRFFIFHNLFFFRLQRPKRCSSRRRFFLFPRYLLPWGLFYTSPLAASFTFNGHLGSSNPPPLRELFPRSRNRLFIFSISSSVGFLYFLD